MNNGDFVTLKEDNPKIVYKVLKITGDQITIKGYTHRVLREVTIDELEVAKESFVSQEVNTVELYQKRLAKRVKNKNMLFGRILHIDGDPDYLESCLKLYKDLGFFAEGMCIRENQVSSIIDSLVDDITPDIVVITGHDDYNKRGLKDLVNYVNTKNFIQAIRVIRKKHSLDDIVIISGACGSNSEALIASGANFASSPSRIAVHTYDPAVIAIKVASTSTNQILDFDLTLKHIEQGRKAYMGIETKGKMRVIY